MRTVERTMFYGANAETFEYAAILRKNETIAEKRLWERLSNKQLGYKFRRQHPIKFFIADFYCHQLKLVIEVDGDIHLLPERKEYDINRAAEIEHLGIRIIRFTNREVLGSMESVVQRTQKAIKELEKITG